MSKSKMNPEVKSLWLKAMRSNEYEQGHGYLKASTRDGKMQYCCLGVLCDLYEKHSGKPLGFEGTEPGFNGKVFRHGKKAYNLPPEEVVKWAGLPSAWGFENDKTPISMTDEVTGEKVVRKVTGLPALNDNYNFSFEEIANVIEEHL